MRAGSWSVPLLLIMVVLGGCIGPDAMKTTQVQQVESEPDPADPEQNNTEELDEDDVFFEWTSPDGMTDLVYLIEITAGENTTCTNQYQAGGGLPPDTDLVAQTHHYTDSLDHLWLSMNVWGGAIVGAHAGPINTLPWKNTVTATISEYTWGLSGGPSVSNETRGRIVVGLEMDPADPAQIEVTCDSPDASVQFYLADDFRVISSNAPEEGVGFQATAPMGQWVGLNFGDRFSIEGEGDRTMLALTEHPFDSTLGSWANGEMELETPNGSEPISYALEEKLWLLTREWNTPGAFALNSDRQAKGYWALSGILANFALEETAGKTDL